MNQVKVKAFAIPAIALALAAVGCSGGDASSPSPNGVSTLLPGGFEGNPLAVAVAPNGEVYFSAHNVVYAVDAEGKGRVVAGNGTPGYSGDGGPATEALLNFPASHAGVHPLDDGPDVAYLAVDEAGNLAIADALNYKVRRVDRTGLISSIADISYPRGMAFGRSGSLYIASYEGIRRVSSDGSVTVLGGQRWYAGLAVDAVGNVLFAAGCRVWRVEGVRLLEIAGTASSAGENCGYSGDGPNSASLNFPRALAVDPLGNVLIADTGNNCIRKVDPAGVHSRFAGRCGPGSTFRGLGDGGRAVDADLSHPHGVASDKEGNVYIADTGNWRIRKVDVNGVITTVAELSRPRP